MVPAEDCLRVFRQGTAVLVQVRPQPVVLPVLQIGGHEGHMMPQVMLRPPGLLDSVLQVDILQVLQQEHVVLLFQLHVPTVFTEQPGHDVVDQESPQIDAQQEQGIGGLQGHIQAGLPAAIEMVEPQQIEGGRNQPQIPPYGSVRLFLHRVRIHIPDVEEQRDQDDGLHRCHEDGKRPPICLHRKPGEDLRPPAGPPAPRCAS